MSIANEFKQFDIKGNAVDMAVGIIIGAAFGKIVSSIVEDLIMSIVGKLIGGINSLTRKKEEAPAAPPEDILLLREIRDALIKK